MNLLEVGKKEKYIIIIHKKEEDQKMELKISSIEEKCVKVEWEPVDADSYAVFWADTPLPRRLISGIKI